MPVQIFEPAFFLSEFRHLVIRMKMTTGLGLLQENRKPGSISSLWINVLSLFSPAGSPFG